MAPKTPTQQLLEEAQREYEQVQNELKEIDMLIQQTVAEVDRLAQRNTHATNRLHQIEANLDSVPRQDIREAYTAVQESQQRLFTMRGQLEKLQSDQRSMEKYARLLRRVIEITGETVSAAKGDADQVPIIVRVIEAQERERQHMARLLHDGPAQALTNLVLQAEICERLFTSDAERAKTELANLKSAVASTFERVRGFISDLRPMMLDDLGLIPTMRRYVEDYNLKVQLTISGRERRIASYKEVTIFRVIQTLLNNARDFSHATSVQVALDMGEDVVRVTVEDDGSGFDVADLTGGAVGEEMGLPTLRERIEMLKGSFDVDSTPGRGTRVAFTVPLP